MTLNSIDDYIPESVSVGLSAAGLCLKVGDGCPLVTWSLDTV